MKCQEPTCGKPFEPQRSHARFCSDACRLRSNRRNARNPVEPSATARTAAMNLAFLVGARQAGKIRHGEFAAAAVKIITSEFPSVNDALIALGSLAWEGMQAGITTTDQKQEKVR